MMDDPTTLALVGSRLPDPRHLMSASRAAADNACLLRERLTVTVPADAGAVARALRRRPRLRELALEVDAREDPLAAIAALDAFPFDVAVRCDASLRFGRGAPFAYVVAAFESLCRHRGKFQGRETAPWSVSLDCEAAEACGIDQAAALDAAVRGAGLRVQAMAVAWPAHSPLMCTGAWRAAASALRVTVSEPVMLSCLRYGPGGAPVLTVPCNACCGGVLRQLAPEAWGRLDHLVVDALAGDDLEALELYGSSLKALSFCYLPVGNAAYLRLLAWLQACSVPVLSVACVDDVRVLHLVRSLPRRAFVLYPATAMDYYIGCLVRAATSPDTTCVLVKPPLDGAAVDPGTTTLEQAKNKLRLPQYYGAACAQWLPLLHPL
jgi:hypothetical protein